MSDNKELLPCPFCGSEAKVKTRATRMVNCTQCSASTFEPHDDEFGALKEWNRRAAQPVVLSDERCYVILHEMAEHMLTIPDDSFTEEQFCGESVRFILNAAKEQA